MVENTQRAVIGILEDTHENIDISTASHPELLDHIKTLVNSHNKSAEDVLIDLTRYRKEIDWVIYKNGKRISGGKKVVGFAVRLASAKALGLVGTNKAILALIDATHDWGDTYQEPGSTRLHVYRDGQVIREAAEDSIWRILNVPSQKKIRYVRRHQ